jgi:transketolase
VIENVDGHAGEAVKKAVRKARRDKSKPCLICCRTRIAFGSPGKEGSSGSHGAPLGEEEAGAVRKRLGWSCPPFEIPAAVRSGWDARKSGKAEEKRWSDLFACYEQAYPEEAEEFKRRIAGRLPEDWTKVPDDYARDEQKHGAPKATRVASNELLDAIAPRMPELLGGSADLSASVGTKWKGAEAVTGTNFRGRYIFYGVREFSMGCIMNGLALHGGFIPYAGTFLVFSDYAKSAMRLSALMKLRLVWVLSHDSVMVGEDGPTHQPVEQLAMLRSMPGMDVWRPCDAVECAYAWKAALSRKDGPTSLALSRQNLPVAPRGEAADIGRGAYILKESKGGAAEIILIATGSEVSLALAAAEVLEKKDRRVRVVSMPCSEVFDRQDRDYKEKVLPHDLRCRVALEAASTDFWRRYVGLDGSVVGMMSFGESAPGPAVYDYFGFNVAGVLEAVKTACRNCGITE